MRSTRLALAAALVAIASLLDGALPAAAAIAPGRYAVHGKPLAGTTGAAVSVFPQRGLVTVEGCRTRSSRVRGVAVQAVVTCGRTRATLGGVLSASRLRGTFTRDGRARAFTAVRAQQGVVLRGAGPATGHVPSVHAAVRHALDLSAAPDGSEVARTEVEVTLAPDATVAQVDAALALVGGRIVSAVAGDDRPIVAIPDPGSLGALDRLIALLGASTGIEHAERSALPDADALPPGTATPPTASQAAELSHLLAVRAPAAWNARAAIHLADRPTVILSDDFGNGPLSRHVDATYRHADLGRFGAFSDHGYRVASVIAGDLASDGTPAGRVAGMFPATTILKVLDERGYTAGVEETDLLDAMKATGGHVVANTSWGWKVKKDDADAIQEGADWAIRVRAAGLESRVAQAASAGNVTGRSAQTNSAFDAAATRSDLQHGGAPVPPLTNTLAVENVVDSGAPDYAAGCLDRRTSSGGSVSAVGRDVWTLDAHGRASNASGSSFAAPLVTGLAEYLWSLAPDLDAAQVMGAIRATAHAAPASCGIAPAPTVDAYAAVLSLDQTVAPTAATAPVRLAILDVDGNGSFDAADLRTLAAAAFATAGRHDWSRLDLNGDGVTGGPGTAPFDLDPTGSTRAGAPVLGTAVTIVDGLPRTFDETAASDADVLCFYAHSALYTGSVADRDAILGGARQCQEPVEPVNVVVGARSAAFFLEAHGTAGAVTAPSATQSANAPAGLDPVSLIVAPVAVDADPVDGANELRTHAEGNADVTIGPTAGGGVAMAARFGLAATWALAGTGVGSATATSSASLSLTVENVPARVVLSSQVTGAATFKIQVGTDPATVQPNGQLSTTLAPGSYVFVVSCNAVATVATPSRACTADVDVDVEPGA